MPEDMEKLEKDLLKAIREAEKILLGGGKEGGTGEEQESHASQAPAGQPPAGMEESYSRALSLIKVMTPQGAVPLSQIQPAATGPGQAREEAEKIAQQLQPQTMTQQLQQLAQQPAVQPRQPPQPQQPSPAPSQEGQGGGEAEKENIDRIAEMLNKMEEIARERQGRSLLDMIREKSGEVKQQREKHAPETGRGARGAETVAPPSTAAPGPEQAGGMVKFYHVMVVFPSRARLQKIEELSEKAEVRKPVSRLGEEAIKKIESIRTGNYPLFRAHGFIRLGTGFWVTADKEKAKKVAGELYERIRSVLSEPVVRKALHEMGYSDYTVEKLLESVYKPRIISIYIPAEEAVQLLEEALATETEEHEKALHELRGITEKKRRERKLRDIEKKKEYIEAIQRTLDQIKKLAEQAAARVEEAAVPA